MVNPHFKYVKRALTDEEVQDKALYVLSYYVVSDGVKIGVVYKTFRGMWWNEYECNFETRDKAAQSAVKFWLNNEEVKRQLGQRIK